MAFNGPSLRRTVRRLRRSPRDFAYLLVALALVPLGLSTYDGPGPSVKDRLDAALDRAEPEVTERLRELEETEGGFTLDELLALLPGDRLDDAAHLPRRTVVHWLYAGLAALGFWGLTLLCFPGERRSAGRLMAIGLFTATIGIILLIAVQRAAERTNGLTMTGGGLAVLIFYLVKFIGWSYASADDPGANFFVSALGYTFGVGLCEELCKALPMLFHFRRPVETGWRGAALMGLASGAGFGISEGVMYAARHYNGIVGGDIYLIRFVSCVALHATWAAAVGIAVWRRQDWYRGSGHLLAFLAAILRILAVPMALHGLYDTLLKMDHDGYAMLAGAASVLWLAIQVERARRTDPVPEADWHPTPERVATR